MLEYLLYAIIIAPAALTGYRRSVREGHDSTSERQRQGTDRYKQAQKKALITKRYLDNQCLNFESGWLGSNQRPHAPQTRTLNQLSYTPILWRDLEAEASLSFASAKVVQTYETTKQKTEFLSKIGQKGRFEVFSLKKE